MGNLLDNAYRWCSSQIEITLTEKDGVQRLIIGDDGPGFKNLKLIERGKRGDESKSGSGLGLAIVKDIAKVYRGRVELQRSDTLGGSEVVVELPIK